jgi:hypothetical protein
MGFSPWILLWLASIFVLFFAQIGLAWYQQRARRAAWQRAATRLGLQLSGAGWALMLSGRWQDVEVVVSQRVEYHYKSEPAFHIELSARLPGHESWVEQRLPGSVDADRLETLLEPVVAAVRSGKTGVV